MGSGQLEGGMSSITGRLDAMIAASASDARLAKIMDDVFDYAQIYSLARQRQDGCAGKGELFALRAEFSEFIAQLSEYSVKQGYITSPLKEDIDHIADVILLKSKISVQPEGPAKPAL
jgi:hypothetical protein